MTSDFFGAFVTFFIFLTSGENWDSIVYMAYANSLAYAFFFLPLVGVGIFLLMSMLIATFEQEHHKSESTLIEGKHQRWRQALSASFVLSTWNEKDHRKKFINNDDTDPDKWGSFANLMVFGTQLRVIWVRV